MPLTIFEEFYIGLSYVCLNLYCTFYKTLIEIKIHIFNIFKIPTNYYI